MPIATSKPSGTRGETGRWEFRGPHRLLPLLIVLPVLTLATVTLGWPWLEQRLPVGAAAGATCWIVFEHSLLRPGETEPYGWTWAAGRLDGGR